MISISVIGDKKLRKYVKGIEVNVPKAVEKGSNKWGLELQKNLRRVAPVWTGALKEGIQWKMTRRNGTLAIPRHGVLVGIMRPHYVSFNNPTAYQWALDHWGAGAEGRKGMWVNPQRSVGNPWFRNTIEMSLNRLHQGLNKEVSQSIRRTK